MANPEDQPIIPKYFTIKGRVTPVDGVYRENIPVELSGNPPIAYTDSDGYFEGGILFSEESEETEIVANVGDDKATWKLKRFNRIKITSTKESRVYVVSVQLMWYDKEVEIENKRIQFINADTGQVLYSGNTNLAGKTSQSFPISNNSPLYVYAKCEDIVSDVVPASTVLWAPALNGETGANYRYSYSEANGEAVGKGFYLKGGFPNVKRWQLSFEFRHDNIRYTGIGFVSDMSFTSNGDLGGLRSWEGGWPGGSAYANYNAGTIDWFDVTVTKIDSTHVRLQSQKLNRDTTVELAWLPNFERLSCGAHHHASSPQYGPCRIRNVKATLLEF